MDKYFTNLTEIGKGGFGSVYSATTTAAAKKLIGRNLPDVIAMKNVQFDEYNIKLLRDEMKIMKRLSTGPGTSRTMTYYGCLQLGNDIYIVSELVKGQQLLKLILDGKLTLVQKKIITTELALGIADLHVAGIIHRDLKPENIMFDTETNKLTLLDYGLSCYSYTVKHLLHKNKFHMVGECFNDAGTHAYMDPQLNFDGSDSLDSIMVGDWWAYGQIIYALYHARMLYIKGEDGKPGEFMIDDKLPKIPEKFRVLFMNLTNPYLSQRKRYDEYTILKMVTGIEPKH